MDLAKKLIEMRGKKKTLDKFISKKYISKSLKFFIDDIVYLVEENNFSLKEHKEILEDVLGFDINYQTYSSFFNRNIKSKLKKGVTKKVNDKKEDTSSGVKPDEKEEATASVIDKVAILSEKEVDSNTKKQSISDMLMTAKNPKKIK